MSVCACGTLYASLDMTARRLARPRVPPLCSPAKLGSAPPGSRPAPSLLPHLLHLARPRSRSRGRRPSSLTHSFRKGPAAPMAPSSEVNFSPCRCLGRPVGDADAVRPRRETPPSFLHRASPPLHPAALPIAFGHRCADLDPALAT